MDRAQSTLIMASFLWQHQSEFSRPAGRNMLATSRRKVEVFGIVATASDNPLRIRVDVSPSEHVTALAYRGAPGHRIGVTLILGHGAGANQTSGFMVHFATSLAASGVDTVTFNFAYTEQGRRVPDKNDKLESCWRAVIATVLSGDLPAGKGEEAAGRKLVIGGKSMGGRIASQIASRPATAGEENIAGLVFLGYPLHPPGRPDKLRSAHLAGIRAPMLFVQGSRDAFGTPDELRAALAGVTAADLYVVDGGDHSFKVPKRGAISQEQVHDAVLDEIVRWMRARIG
jgi:predicted alpha/beta-hydrolase family hydrolase